MRRLGFSLLLLLGCAPDLRDEYPFDGDLPDGEYVVVSDLGNGVSELFINAGEKESWVYVDLDVPEHVKGDVAVGGTTWDVAFQRFKIISNGGVSGVGSVSVAALPGQDFDALQTAPSSGYLVDAADGPDGNSDVDSAFLIDDGWYLYDFSQHRLVPRDVVYVVHTDQGYRALKMLSYYDEAGTSARLRLLLKTVAEP